MKIINKVILFSMLASMPISCETCVKEFANPEDSLECKALKLEYLAALNAKDLAGERLDAYPRDGVVKPLIPNIQTYWKSIIPPVII